MFTIKRYTSKDYDMIKSWWEAQKMMPPTQDMLPLDSTYILCLEDTPALCVSIYFTNVKEYCYLECFIGNPEANNKPQRREATQILFDFVCDKIRERGHKKVVWISPTPTLTRYYKTWGLEPTITNVDTFCKVL